jgi:hypothetical protein
MRDKYEMGFTGSSDNPEGERAIWKKIWSVSVPSKVKVFTWKVVRNGLPTRLTGTWRRRVVASYVVIQRRTASILLYISCPHARALRVELRKHLALPAEAHLRNHGPEWLLATLNRYDAQVGANFLMLTRRCWMVRNGVLQLQVGEDISIAGLVLFLTKYVATLFQIRQQDAPVDGRGEQKMFLEKVKRVLLTGERGEARWVPPRMHR